ncbi:hypothetical protein WN943_000314 [Citrus x changshan-huyou]
MLYVYMAYSGDQLQKSMEKPIIMSETVPSSVYVGFTAATGELSESHQLLDWTFTTFPLPSYSPRKQYLEIWVLMLDNNSVTHVYLIGNSEISSLKEEDSFGKILNIKGYNWKLDFVG